MHEPQEPTLNEYGDEVHPAFGMIRAARVSGGSGVLFDSDLQHQHSVVLTVERATRKRDLNHDWIHGTSRLPLIEVQMSEAQWAAFVSSMNTSGVPCTIRATERNPDVPGLHFAPRLAESMTEVRGAADRLFEKAQTAMDAYDAIAKTGTAKEKREALDRVRSSLRNARANMEFAAQSMTEHAENVVQRARADIEAMVTHKATQLGLTGADVPTLSLPVGTTHEGDED